MATANTVPSYAHNGLKVFVLQKNDGLKTDKDDFFAKMYEDLNEDIDDISFTGSFLRSSHFDQIVDYPAENIYTEPVHYVHNYTFVHPENDVVHKIINNESQTDVSLIDQKFILQNYTDSKIKTKDKCLLTDAIAMRHASSETNLLLSNQSVSTDPVQFIDDDRMKELRNNLNIIESENIRLQNLLDQTNKNSNKLHSNSNNSNVGVQTSNKLLIVSTSCQATVISSEANSQTQNFSKDVSSQYENDGEDFVDVKTNVSEDVLRDQNLLKLEMQQNQLAWERQLRAKIGEIDLLESKLSDMELSVTEEHQLNEALQQQLKNLKSQIEEKDRLISDLELIRSNNEELKEKLSSDAKMESQQQLKQHLLASEAREKELLSQIDELLKKESELNKTLINNQQNQFKYDQLKQQYDDLNNSSNDLKSSLFATKADISNLNMILRQKDEFLKKLLEENNFNKENTMPIKSMRNALNSEDDEVKAILKNVQDENISPIGNKKRLPIKNITEVGRAKTKYFELKLYEDLKQQYLNRTFSKNIYVHNIPEIPSNFHCLKQQNGKIFLEWNPDKSNFVDKYKICINNSRTITIDNNGSGSFDLLLNQSELNCATLKITLYAINSRGISSDPIHLKLNNLNRSHSTEDDLKMDLRQKSLCIAVYDYEPSSKSRSTAADVSELKFKTGDFIETYGPHRSDGFFYAKLRGSEAIGLVPKHFIEEIRQLQMPFLK